MNDTNTNPDATIILEMGAVLRVLETAAHRPDIFDLESLAKSFRLSLSDDTIDALETEQMNEGVNALLTPFLGEEEGHCAECGCAITDEDPLVDITPLLLDLDYIDTLLGQIDLSKIDFDVVMSAR